jgi:hypothetical protein
MVYIDATPQVTFLAQAAVLSIQIGDFDEKR